MPLVGNRLKYTAAVGGAYGCVTEGPVIPGSTKHLGRSISYPMITSLPLMNVSLNMRYVVKKIFIVCSRKLGREFSLCTYRQEVLFCWDKLENLGKDFSNCHELFSDNRDTAASADVGDKLGLTFESLRLKCRDRISLMVKQPPSQGALRE